MSDQSNASKGFNPVPFFNENGRIAIKRTIFSRFKYGAFAVIFGITLHLFYGGLLAMLHGHNPLAPSDFVFALSVLLDFGFVIYFWINLCWALMMFIFAHRIELESDQFTVVRYGTARSFKYSRVRNVFVKDVTKGPLPLELVIEGCTNLYNDFTISIYDLGNLIIQLRAVSAPMLPRIEPLRPIKKSIIARQWIIIIGVIVTIVTVIGFNLNQQHVHW